MTPGIWQILLIVLIVFLIFGAGKLPNVMGDLAKGVRNFKKGLNEDEGENSGESNAAPQVTQQDNAADADKKAAPSKTAAKK